MATITGMVALILVGVALATSAILGGVLQTSLDVQLTQSVARLGATGFGFPQGSRDAAEVLADSPAREPGFLLVLAASDGPTGAYIDDDGYVQVLEEERVDELIDAVSDRDVTVRDLGDYRITLIPAPGGGGIIGIGGISVAETRATVTQILTTVALVTAVGLLLLAAAIAIILRASLRPLRAVADTATRVAGVPMARGAVSISERVPEDEADDRTEVGRVGAALNTLLDHVDASLDARQRNEERMRRFVADASHELRTPLASIRGYSELSLRDPELSETTGSALERIQAQSLRMTTLVEDLLLLARLDEGQELVYGSVDLTRLTVESVGDVRPTGPDHRWVIDIDDDPVLIAGDAARLQQLIVNLLANARTHTPAGTTVTASLIREDEDAVLRVHDDGPGVDPAVADELFQRFSRADRSRARQTGGTGLGLSIARAIAEAHHGTIEVDSVPGDTTFTVRLPARPADPVED